MAYDRLDPIGRSRLDLHAAMICRTLSNIFRGKDKPAFEVKDFLPRWGPPDPDEEARSLRATLEAHSHTIERVPSGSTDRPTGR